VSDATVVLLGLALGTYALKAVGPLLFGGRRLPPALGRLIELLPAAMLAALVVVTTFADGQSLVLDARAAGLAAAAAALTLRAPFVVVVIAAAAAAALVRAL
jgi:branched-subunit amino acid transport protein